MDADSRSGEPFRLLFVCTGNTCRSPLAEVLARRALSERGWTHVEVRSAGVGAYDGGPASVGSLRAAQRHGLDLSEHASRLLTAETLDWADLVLTMSPSHFARVADLGGDGKADLLTTFAAAEDPDGVPDSVLDPFGGSDDEYEMTYLLLERLVDRAIQRLSPLLAP